MTAVSGLGSGPRCAVCVPTLNAGSQWSAWLECIGNALQDTHLLVIDSSSDDKTAELAREAGAEVHVIPRSNFDHGGTRDWAMRYLDGYDIVVFLTQDAWMIESVALKKLIAAFDDPCVGAAYGRQLPSEGASPFAAHVRYFNYPEASYLVDPTNIPQMGIKAAFLSNSFAAYRREALLAVGGFPSQVILGEDMLAGARLLQAGWKLAYCAEARVKHSHNYSLGEEFRRYFDIGVMHSREKWLLDFLGKAEGEGARFLRSELCFLWHRAPMLLPQALLRNALKYMGYRLGRVERHLPLPLKRHCSMHPQFWLAKKS